MNEKIITYWFDAKFGGTWCVALGMVDRHGVVSLKQTIVTYDDEIDAVARVEREAVKRGLRVVHPK